MPNASLPLSPAALSVALKTYLAHVIDGRSLRDLARTEGVHPSTILRRVRRVETRRDDPLLDEALDRAGATHAARPAGEGYETRDTDMTDSSRVAGTDPALVEREARRILRRLCESNAILVVAPGMERAAVLRETVPGRPTRTAVVDRDVAHAFSLNEWIGLEGTGKVSRYTITEIGRAALRRLIAEDRNRREGADSCAFAEQQKIWGERTVTRHAGSGRTQIRYNLAESPLTVLARKRGPDGGAYMTADLIDAGERLREDFELARMGPRVAQGWDRMGMGGGKPTGPGRGPADGPSRARGRFHAAIDAMGPGLSDIAQRVCCHLEGLEAAEKRLGWSARSGKVVLKIALERLALHYAGLRQAERMIG